MSEESDLGMHDQEKMPLGETVRWGTVLEKTLVMGTDNLCRGAHRFILSAAGGPASLAHCHILV